MSDGAGSKVYFWPYDIFGYLLPGIIVWAPLMQFHGSIRRLPRWLTHTGMGCVGPPGLIRRQVDSLGSRRNQNLPCPRAIDYGPIVIVPPIMSARPARRLCSCSLNRASPSCPNGSST